MIKKYYTDLLDDTGQIGMMDWRCISCGEVIHPVILRNRVNPTADLVHVAKQRKYAHRVDHGQSDGQDQERHGNDRPPGDSPLVGPER